MGLDNLILFYFLGTIIIVIFAVSLTILLIFQKNRNFRNKLEKKELQNKYSNQLLQTKIEVQEQSLKYFSEEIHDSILQVLSIIKMQLHSIKGKSDDPAITTNATNGLELVVKVIADLRNMSHTMDGAYVDRTGLMEAIRKDIAYINSAKQVNCTLTVEGESQPFEPGIELIVFRIIQESIANSLKHGLPTNIGITTLFKHNYFKVTIRDNGKGFHLSQLAHRGVGLTNMELRAKMINAALTIDSAPETGTTVTLELPYLQFGNDNFAPAG